uniref:Uncharacterized protein n=1 Tax=Amphiprion ocellaris TaxID=80972 RepID=A0AAQ5X2W2_AMPOC
FQPMDYARKHCGGKHQAPRAASEGPSVGLFLLGLSAALCLLPSSGSNLSSLQREAVWAGELLAPALVSFDFLWLSQDRNTAYILLCGSCLLLGLSDWLSADSLTAMTRCLGLSSLSCSLTVCLFAGNAVGALGGVALSLPLLVAPGNSLLYGDDFNGHTTKLQ